MLEVPSDSRGNVDLERLQELCDDSVVGLMITNPNTLGLFEEQVVEVVALIHGCGGLIYGDGANMNALLGVARPGDLGFDVCTTIAQNLQHSSWWWWTRLGSRWGQQTLLPFMPGPIVMPMQEEDGLQNLALPENDEHNHAHEDPMIFHSIG